VHPAAEVIPGKAAVGDLVERRIARHRLHVVSQLLRETSDPGLALERSTLPAGERPLPEEGQAQARIGQFEKGGRTSGQAPQ
jgi:hypothetical protein